MKRRPCPTHPTTPPPNRASTSSSNCGHGIILEDYQKKQRRPPSRGTATGVRRVPYQAALQIQNEALQIQIESLQIQNETL